MLTVPRVPLVLADSNPCCVAFHRFDGRDLFWLVFSRHPQSRPIMRKDCDNATVLNWILEAGSATVVPAARRNVRVDSA